MNFIKNNFKIIFVVASIVIIGVGTLIYDLNKPSLSDTTSEKNRLDIFIDELKSIVPIDPSGNTIYDISRNNNVLTISYSNNDVATGATAVKLTFNYDDDTKIVSLNNTSPINLYELVDGSYDITPSIYIISLFTDYLNTHYVYTGSDGSETSLMQMLNTNPKIGNMLTMSKTGINMYYNEIIDNLGEKYFNGLSSFEIKLMDCEEATSGTVVTYNYPNYNEIYPNAAVSNISIAEATNGKVEISSLKRVNSNDVITLKTTPSSGYALNSLTISDSDNKDITESVGYVGATLTFNMPSSNVTVTPVFTEASSNYTIDGLSDTITVEKDKTANISPRFKKGDEEISNVIFEYASGDESIATVKRNLDNKTAVITGVGVGETTLKVTSKAESDDTISDQTKTITIKVTEPAAELIEPVIAVQNITMSVGEKKEVNLEGKDAEGNIIPGTYTVTVANDLVATATDKTIEALESGSSIVNIEFTPTDTTKYKSTITSFNLVVKDAEAVAPTISASDLSINVGDIKSAVISVVDSNGTAVEGKSVLSTTDSKIISIDNLNIKGLADGSATVNVEFTPTNTTKYKTVSTSFKVTVSTNKTEVPLKVDDVTLYVGQTKDLTFDVNGISGSSTLVSSDGTMVSVDGISITGLKKGTTTLKLTFAPKDTDKYTTATKEFKVTVKEMTIDDFVSDLKESVSSVENLDVTYSNNILSLYYCKDDCETDTDANKTKIDLTYNSSTNILTLNKSIKLFSDTFEIHDEFNAFTIISAYISKKGNPGISDLITYALGESSTNNGLLAMTTSGMNLYFSDVKKYEAEDVSVPTVINSFEYKITDNTTESKILKVDIKSKTGGTISINKIATVNGKDIVTLKATPDTKYGFDSLTIKDSNGKDITKDVNFNSSTMTFEMPSSDVTIEATFITNAKTGIIDVTMLLVITMVAFGLGLYIVRKNIGSLEI